MGAQLLVDPLMAALAGEMQIELAEPRCGVPAPRMRHQKSRSSIRWMPATGMRTQSGRLSSS